MHELSRLYMYWFIGRRIVCRGFCTQSYCMRNGAQEGRCCHCKQYLNINPFSTIDKISFKQTTHSHNHNKHKHFPKIIKAKYAKLAKSYNRLILANVTFGHMLPNISISLTENQVKIDYNMHIFGVFVWKRFNFNCCITFIKERVYYIVVIYKVKDISVFLCVHIFWFFDFA